VTIEGARLQLGGVPSGPWTVEHWDTAAGVVTGPPAQVEVGEDKSIRLALPPITWDTAYRLLLQER
jgi:hypothetical protein